MDVCACVSVCVCVSEWERINERAATNLHQVRKHPKFTYLCNSEVDYDS